MVNTYLKYVINNRGIYIYITKVNKKHIHVASFLKFCQQGSMNKEVSATIVLLDETEAFLIVEKPGIPNRFNLDIDGHFLLIHSHLMEHCDSSHQVRGFRRMVFLQNVVFLCSETYDRCISKRKSGHWNATFPFMKKLRLVGSMFLAPQNRLHEC